MARKKACDTEGAVFATRLRDLMKKNATTQQILADVLSVKRQTISLYTTGQSKPNVEQLGIIAQFFDVSADYLLGLTDALGKAPAAVDELNLSNESIRTIQAITHNTDNPNLATTLQVLLENPKFYAFLDLLTDSLLKGAETVASPRGGRAVPMLIKSDSPGYSLIHDSMLKEYYVQLAMNTLRGMLEDVTVEVAENGQHS